MQDLVANAHLISSATWRVIEHELNDAALRAVLATAQPPLTYIGTGMTAIVFCDSTGMAFKVARHPQLGVQRLRDEAEWLATAAGTPIRDQVAALYAYDEIHDVILRECVRGDAGRWSQDRPLRALHDHIKEVMLPHGWSAPEFKEDSYVFTERGPVLVDAGMAYRVGPRLLSYTIEILEGRRPRGALDSDRDLAFALRMEVGRSLTAEEAAPVLALLPRE